jgi:hypothetical protein
MNPLLGFTLTQAEQPSLHDLEGIRLQVDQDTQQSILGCRPRTVRVRRVPARGAWLPIETPVGHMGLEGGLTWGDQRPQLVHGETGHIEHLCRAGLEIGEPSRSHGHGLLSLEA